MKTKFLFALYALVLGLSAQAKDYRYETVKGDMTLTRIYTLDNGLKVYLSVNNEKPRIQTFIAVRTGSKNDPAETTGLAHYLEHLMFKGTTHFGTTDAEAEAPLLNDIKARYERYRLLTDPEQRKQAYHEIDSVSQVAAQYFIPNEYDKLMAAIGAEGTNAFTSNDVTCYTEDIPSNEIENWAKIQSDRFQNMVIRGFHTELEAVYEEYNIYLTNDNDKVMSAMGKKLTPTHPYGTQTTIGTQEHLKNPSIVNIENYFKKWYVPNNVAVCMAGDFDPDKTIAIIDQYFGGWQPALSSRPSKASGDISSDPSTTLGMTCVPQPVFPVQKPLTTPVDTTVVGQQAEQVWMGWLAKKASDLQCDTLDVIAYMLNNGKAGLIDLNLNQAMRVQGAGCGLQAMQDYSSFLMMGMPKPNQSLEEVRTLLLGEIENLKKGNFSDDLLPAVINNLKLDYQRSLESNRWRVGEHLEAFINGESWEQHVGRLNRASKLTKQQIVDFANRFFTEGYATIFKRQGVDSLQKKIDKPAITPIPTNRDFVSQFVKDIQNSQVEPIHPEFVDFDKALTIAQTKGKLPLLYVKNTTDGLFNLTFRYEFGHEDDNRYDMVSDYLDVVGTKELTATQVKQKFYNLACSYSVNANSDNLNISLSGLSENMPAALHLLEDLLQNAQGDQDSYNSFVEMIMKARENRKQDQRTCFDYLYHYALYGPHNIRRDDMTEQQLREAKPQELLNLLADLRNMEHSVLYYGPMSVQELSDLLAQEHPTPQQMKPVPQGKPFTRELTPKNEIWIAPYDAKNIYMRMYHNENRAWNPAENGVQTLFNEYYGSGMNGIVFQEMREARGLAYNAGAAYLRPDHKGEKEFFFTHIISQNDKMMDCINQFHQILDTIPQSEAAFQIAKESVLKLMATSRVRKGGIISRYIMTKRLGLEKDLSKATYQAIQQLQLKDIVAFEEANMARKPFRYIILGDEKELDMPALEKIGPIRRLTLEEVFGY